MSLDIQDLLLDIAAFKASVSGGDNSKEIERMKNNLRLAIRQELTKNQQEILLMYYFENKSIPQISDIKGVNKASVSKMLKRARARLLRVLKYST
ncbi:MAG: sigma-70 region 4 domain-containing protein [Clostridia bacterium]|nr:sigma-70 region 4 domain-containing protein [Clostridia bacterium]